jgi:organic hydroperoxide reductase OsmC/OhrA
MRHEHSYRVAAWWTSGRTGIAKSDSAPNAIHFTAPPEFGGLEGRWTLEELLLASIASCFSVTARVVATREKFEFLDLQVEAKGTVCKADSGYSFREIVVQSQITIPEGHGEEEALHVLRSAESLCLVSRAISTALRFEHEIVLSQALASV